MLLKIMDGQYLHGIHYTNYLTDKYASTAPLNKSHKILVLEPIFHFNVEDIQSNGFSQIIQIISVLKVISLYISE